MLAVTNNIKRATLLCVLLFLFIPLIQNTFYVKKWIAPLHGAFSETKDTTLTTQGWFSNQYQTQKENYLNESFGLRNYYVKLNHQISFSLFGKITAKNVVAGKYGMLYEKPYIDAYYGVNFSGEEKLKKQVQILKQAQTILKEKGIDLEIIFAPGKASYYSEYIPDEYKSKSFLTNYKMMRLYAKEFKLSFIDFNDWFMKLKSKSIYELYPMGGIHWSNYGAMLAIDSLKKHIEYSTELKLRRYVITNYILSDSLIDPDNDIEDAVNLLFKSDKIPMMYPKYDWVDNGDEIKPTALFVGDSYFWNWYYQGFIHNFFTDAKFWYYNQTSYPDNKPVNELSFKDEVLKNKVIVLLATESNIHDIGWGFANKVIETFNQNKEEHAVDVSKTEYLIEDNDIIKEYVQKITSNVEWFTKIKKNVLNNNVTIEKQLIEEALFAYKQEYGKPEIQSELNNIKNRIKSTPDWYRNIVEKAKQKNISVNDMLEIDAKYVYDAEVKSKNKK